MYDTYIFDLYGTLVDIRTDEESWELWSKMSMLYQYRGANYTPKELHDAYAAEVKNAYHQLQDQEDKEDVFASREIQIEYVFQALFSKKGIDVSISEARQIGEAFRAFSTFYVKEYKGAKELLSSLREKGKKVYLLSNAQESFTMGELRMLGLIPYFDGILISSDCGYKKPDKRFYQSLINKYNIDVTKAIMTGNDYESDILGAANVGLDTCYIASNLSPEKDKKIVDKEAATIELDHMDLHRLRNILINS